MPDISKMTEVVPGLYKASDRSYYVEHKGVLKFIIKERLDKLVQREGTLENVVKNYRTRQHGAKKETKPEVKETEKVEEVTTLAASAGGVVAKPEPEPVSEPVLVEA